MEKFQFALADVKGKKLLKNTSDFVQVVSWMVLEFSPEYFICGLQLRVFDFNVV